MSLLEIEGLTHSFGENLLYKNAGFVSHEEAFYRDWTQRIINIEKR